MKHLILAFKMLHQDWIAGEIKLLIFALLIAVCSTSSITLFSDRLHQIMIYQAAEFLAADLAISSSMAIDENWQAKAKELGLNQALTTEFNCVLIENQEMQLSSVKAVTQNYPLRGYLKISSTDQLEEQISNQGPAPGETWIEPRIQEALKLKIGDELTIGEKSLIITKILKYEPDKGGSYYSFSPRVLINADDLAATKVIQPGSRVHYVAQFSGNESALHAFKEWTKPQLSAAQRIQDIQEDKPEVGSALTRAEQYLGLASIVVVLIAGVGIAMSTKQYTERHFNTVALLRCLGCKKQQVASLFFLQILLIGSITCLLGCLLGYCVQYGLFYVLKPVLPERLVYPSLSGLFFGFLTGIIVLFGFALPPLLRLFNVAPLRVIRRDLLPLPVSGWLTYSLTFGLISLMIWQYSHDLKMTLTILGSSILAILIFGGLIFMLLKLFANRLLNMGLVWRFGLKGLLRNKLAGVVQILSFSITLTAMTLCYIIQNDLIDNWSKQLPENTPNYFALNIFPDQLTHFQTDLQANHIFDSRFYPVVRGRLIEINAIPVQKRVNKNSQNQEAMQRELSLTSALELPADNNVVIGDAWQPQSPGQISIEQKWADSLGINLGDQLTFSIENETLTAKVINFRTVQWDTMRPNFFVIFSPGTMDGFPYTYLTSFYIADSQKVEIPKLLKTYPAITLLEVKQILQQFKIIINQLSNALGLILYLALFAGYIVLFATVQSTLEQRIHEGVLMRILGANNQFLNRMQIIEFFILGGLAGTIAVINAEIISYLLHSQVLHMPYSANPWLWLMLPIIGASSVTFAGYLGTRKILNISPLIILKGII